MNIKFSLILSLLLTTASVIVAVFFFYMSIPVIFSLILTAVSILIAVYISLNDRKIKKDFYQRSMEIEAKEKSMESKLYELSILKELEDRIGYSLDMRQILDVIVGSLRQFIDYTSVSYMFLEPEKILFKIHLDKSVNHVFIDEIRARVLKALGALLEKDMKGIKIEEVISGAISLEETKDSINSFFTIPIVIGGSVAGIFNVADVKEGTYKEEQINILYKIINQVSISVTKLQKVVNEEQSKLAAMVESMSDGIFMTNLDYKILVINPAAKKAINILPEKEATIFDFVDNLGGKFDIHGRLEESIKLKKVYVSDRILLGDKFFQIFVSPVKSVSVLGQETVYGAVVIFHDVTSVVEVETVRKDFTSMLVHELRSPLDGIKKISEVLKSSGTTLDDKSYDEYIQMIYKNSSGMLELVSDILDVAKIEAGKFSISKREASIADLINDKVRFYSVVAADSEISLKASFGPNVPQNLMFDKDAIDHVLGNFISNAIKYTNKGGQVIVEAFIHKEGADIIEEARAGGFTASNATLDKIMETAEGDFLTVLVSDTGIGMDDESVGSIFNKFKQVDTKSAVPKKQRGTGLGLVIAKGIVKEHGGEIGVSSKVGVGSTFFFTLPLV